MKKTATKKLVTLSLKLTYLMKICKVNCKHYDKNAASFFVWRLQELLIDD
jgi:hypothetical protein